MNVKDKAQAYGKPIQYYKACSRQELAQAADVCPATLTKWINENKNQLIKIGYRPRAILNPAVVRFICEKYCITL